MYPPDTDCQFLIEATSKLHRIHLTVVESELEEALFTECDDYVSIRDREGNETNSKEVARWCGQDFPAAITSSADSLLVHFHSDSVIQKRGFNISVIEFELPGCPPEWHSESLSSPFCYKQFVLPHILPWFDAQKECNFERANLATFQSEREYAYIAETFSQTHSFPWIGYTDANVEGIFETVVDRNAPLWPENFPLKHETEAKDCVFLDWNKREQQVAYEADDCRNRRPFLCKKRKDGSEVPAVLPSGMIRRGFRDFSIDYTILIIIVIALLFLLVVTCVVYQKFKDRHNRVVNVDMNQRLVQQQQQQQKESDRGVGGGRNLMGGKTPPTRVTSSAAHKGTVATAALAKERALAYARNAASAQPPPLESQESALSFPMQQLQMAAMELNEPTDSRQWHAPNEEQPTEANKTQSPRIRLSPNQPQEGEEEEGKKDNGDEEGEEGEERRNLGYEPDSEEEEEETEADQEQGQDEKQRVARRSMADIEAALGNGTDEEIGRNWEGKEHQNVENENEGAERESLSESLGEFRRNGAGRMEVPIRPEITIIRQKKERKEAKEEDKKVAEEMEREKKSWEKEESQQREEEGREKVGEGEEEEEERKRRIGSERMNTMREQRRQTTKRSRRMNTPEEEEGEQEQRMTTMAPPKGSSSMAERKMQTREGTLFSTDQQTVGSHLSTSTRIRTRRKSFEKPPPVGPLDNVSAISLDEFWQKNEA
ncbi:hypothetical protein niasHT_003952 [Heterodera trifolii]|uniref:CUB domain-containing protein n=1 Tax=Heterodera trifolii TaxID=157864 RepID=A0ABD2LY22_9BILA